MCVGINFGSTCVMCTSEFVQNHVDRHGESNTPPKVNAQALDHHSKFSWQGGVGSVKLLSNRSQFSKLYSHDHCQPQLMREALHRMIREASSDSQPHRAELAMGQALFHVEF